VVTIGVGHGSLVKFVVCQALEFEFQAEIAEGSGVTGYIWSYETQRQLIDAVGMEADADRTVANYGVVVWADVTDGQFPKTKSLVKA
jgi:hypothetical protein